MYILCPKFLLAIALMTILSAPLAAQEVPVSNYETVRNGSFLYGNSAWFTMGTYTGLYPEAAADNRGTGLSLRTGMSQDTTTYALQQLYLPTRVELATLSFAWKFEAGQGAQLGGFQVAIASTRGNQIQPVMVIKQWNSSQIGSFGWQQFKSELTLEQMQQLNQLRASGLPIYLYFQLNAAWVNIHVDAISLAVSGSMQFPQLSGRIAFANSYVKESADRFQIYSIDANGGNPRLEYENQGNIYALEWNPDGSGLTFSSSQEMATSPFSGDIYRLSAGSLTKVTTPSNHQQLRSKGGPTGTVKGKVINWSRRTVLVGVMIEGAPAAQFVTLAPYPQPGHEHEYEISGVVDAGSSLQLVHGREGSYVWMALAGVDVNPGGSATAADLIINDSRVSYTATSLSYNNDGSSIYCAFPHIAQVPTSGGIPQSPEGWQSTIPTTGLAHSPTTRQLVYVSGTSNDIYMTDFRSQPRIVVPQGNASWTSSPRWTKDGAGFIFIKTGAQNPTYSNDIHYYHLANGQIAPLTMFFNESVEYADPSPDGRFIVFQRTMSDSNNINGASKSELWIMQADNPSVMWPLVVQGTPAFPRWK